MSTTGLREHPVLKRSATQHLANARRQVTTHCQDLSVSCDVQNLTAVHKVAVQERGYLSDARPKTAGWSLTRRTAEHPLGALSSYLCHTLIIGAVHRELEFELIKVDVVAKNNDAHFYLIEQSDPRTPYDFEVTVHLVGANADQEQIDHLISYAESTRQAQKLAKARLQANLTLQAVAA